MRTVLSISLSESAVKLIDDLKERTINVSKYIEKALRIKYLKDFKELNNEGSN